MTDFLSLKEQILAAQKTDYDMIYAAMISAATELMNIEPKYEALKAENERLKEELSLYKRFYELTNEVYSVAKELNMPIEIFQSLMENNRMINSYIITGNAEQAEKEAI